jgi:tetratricopeptide (TPR) repeat protein
VLAKTAPFLVLSALSGRCPLTSPRRRPRPWAFYPWLTRIVVAVYALWFYLVKTIYPVSLSLLYEVPIPLNPLDPRFVVATAGVLAVSTVVLALRRRWPAGLALWAYYVIALSPTLGIVVRAGFQLAADRYSYLGCLGWALLVGAAVGLVAEARQRGRIGPWPARLAAAAAVAGFVALGALTVRQIEVWRDGDRLWAHAVEVDADCALCHTNLGLTRLGSGATASALEHLEHAVRLRPDRVLVRGGDFGLVLAEAGRLSEAAAQYEMVLTERPGAVQVRQQLAQVLYRMGRREEAMQQLRVAGMMSADDADAQMSLGFALTRLGEPADAVTRFRRAIELGGDVASARLGLVQAYLALGRDALAREEYEALRALDARLARRVVASFLPPSRPDWSRRAVPDLLLNL